MENSEQKKPTIQIAKTEAISNDPKAFSERKNFIRFYDTQSSHNYHFDVRMK